MRKQKWVVSGMISILLLVGMAIGQSLGTGKFEMTENETLKLQSKQKDVVIYQQQIQLLQQQYGVLQAQMQQANKDYMDTAEAVRKAHNWDDAQFNAQTGQFEEKPKEAAKPSATKK